MKKRYVFLILIILINLVGCDAFHNIMNDSKNTEEETTALIKEDILAYESDMFANEYQLNLPIIGYNSGCLITWDIESDYITNTGVILTGAGIGDISTTQITGVFALNGVEVRHDFEIPIVKKQNVEIEQVRNIKFENLTTEYDVQNSNVDLYFEEDGTVPYIKVLDFFDLVEGFIDPNILISKKVSNGVLTLSYDYYDEDYDETYELELSIDSSENTIITNDSAFFWAYTYTTETNYGRNIHYDTKNEEASSLEGNDIVYDLDDYNMDIVLYEGDVMLPYYIANQLFVGSTYYNVYYNYDGLYGTYGVLEDESDEYIEIKSSTMNKEEFPVDLLVHSFDFMAFVFDNLYGLKEIMEVDTYYEVLLENKNELLSSDTKTYEDAVRDFLLKDINEIHTTYRYPSYYNDNNWSGPSMDNLSFYGSRFVTWYNEGLVAVNGAISDKWNITSNEWSAYSEKRPDYWLLDEKSAVLVLDDFYTADIEESQNYDKSIVETILDIDDASILLPSILEGDKYFYYNNSTNDVNKLEILVKNVDRDYVDRYKERLELMDYEFHYNETSDEKKMNGYYEKSNLYNIESDYMIQIMYSDIFELFYVGIVDRVPESYESTWELYADVDNLVTLDSAVYMEMTLDKLLEENSNVNNIVLDITWNTGGNLGALYRVVGFITNDSFRVSNIDASTSGATSYYVNIDYDAYDHLNWSLLISPVTFSAANELATIFYENELGPIIGVSSSGGACSITPILLPTGTAFSMSSNSILAYRTGVGNDAEPYSYHHVEYGITPDYEISINNIYDVSTLLDFIDND